MSSSRTVENPAGSPVNNSLDTTRKWPSTALADAIATEKPLGVRLGSPSVETIVGPGNGLTVKLSKPVSKVLSIQSFTTATGVASTGGSKKQFLQPTTDYTVNAADPANGGNGTLKNATTTVYTAETWIVTYLVADAEGTIGGQSVASRGSTNFPAQ